MRSEAILRLADRGRRRLWSGQTVFLSLSILAAFGAFAYRLNAEPNEIDADIAVAAAPGTPAERAVQDQDTSGLANSAGAAFGKPDEAAATAESGNVALQITPSSGGQASGEAPMIRSRQRADGRSSGPMFGAGDVSADEPEGDPGPSTDSPVVADSDEPTPSTIIVTTSSLSTTTTTTSAPSTTTTLRPSTTTSAPSTTDTTEATTTEPPPTEPPTSAANGPVARNDETSGEAGKDLKIRVLENDSEGAVSIDKDSLTVIGGPSHAKEHRVHGDHLHYRSVDDFSGVDQLSYRVCDKAGLCDQATVIIVIDN